MDLKHEPKFSKLKILQLSCFEVCPKMYIKPPKIACNTLLWQEHNPRTVTSKLLPSFFYHIKSNTHINVLLHHITYHSML